MKLLKFIKDSKSVSPYSWAYTLAYPLYAAYPSFRNRTRLSLSPVAEGNPSADSYSLLFFGDIFATDNPPEVHPSLQNLFQSADAVFGTMECPIVSSLKAWQERDSAVDFWTKSIPEDFVRKLLAQMAVDPKKLILSLANNHAQDWGDEGLRATMRFCEEHGIRYAGVAEPGSPVLTRVRLENPGLTLGVAAFTRWLNQPPSQAFSDPDSFGVHRLSDLINSPVDSDIDLRIALPHWDFEYQHFPSRETRDGATQLSTRGYSIIAGSHTHTIQPLETIAQSLCCYSLGNLLNPGHSLSSSLSSDLGMIWAVSVDKTSKKVSGYRAHPFVHLREQNRLVPLEVADEKYRAIFKKVYR